MWLFFDCRALHGTWKFIAFDIVALEYVVHISRKSYLVLVCEAINYLLIILNIFFIVYSLVPLNIVLNFESFLDYCGCRNEIDGVQTKTKYTKKLFKEMSEKILKSLDNKSPISKNNGDINKITRSNKFARSTGFQHFLCFKNDEVVAPLCIMLPKMSGFIRVFDKSKNMIFFDQE